MRQFKRSDRLAEQILRDVSTLLLHDLAEAVPGLVTFTQVQLSDDLRYARVFFSYLGTDEGRERVVDYFEREGGRIRTLIGNNLRIRHTPEFSFKFDPSVEHGLRIEQLLSEIRNEPKSE